MADIGAARIAAFIDYLRARVGCIYVWGAQGESDISEAWIRKRETSEENASRAIAFWKKQAAKGISPLYAYDCSGLIVRFLQDSGLAKQDLSSRGLYAACLPLLTRDALSPGDLVFRHDGQKIYHVGTYIGAGQVVEAKGRDDGVVQRALDASGPSYWNRYGRLKLFASEGTPPAPPAPPTALPPALPALYAYAGATYVNLRAQPSLEGEISGRVSRGETVLALGFALGWAEVIQRADGGYIRGWCTDAYLKKAEGSAAHA
ncbi:MAG: C40 family peptidase [Christensenellaceae bacterium]|jgi:hypothetical protein|nr:C40 family peptidase [Christensenellaceae bacterium]